jgi:hypothetical protein
MLVRRHSASARLAILATAIAWSLLLPSAASATMPEFAGAQAPSLAPLLREITLAVVNISVRGRVREDNPLYQDPFLRQYFDVPRQLEGKSRRPDQALSSMQSEVMHSPTITLSSMPPAFRSRPRMVNVSMQRSSAAIPQRTWR